MGRHSFRSSSQALRYFRKCVRGSLTVEASVVFPLIIFAIFAIMFLAFYTHDTIVLKSDLTSSVIESVTAGADGSEAREHFLERKRGALFYTRCYDEYADFNENGGKLGVSVRYMVMPYFTRWLHDYKDDTKTEASYEKYSPQHFARQIAGAGELLNINE